MEIVIENTAKIDIFFALVKPNRVKFDSGGAPPEDPSHQLGESGDHFCAVTRGSFAADLKTLAGLSILALRASIQP